MTHLDLDAIRRDARDGLPVRPMTVIALCNMIESLRNAAANWQRTAEHYEARRLVAKMDKDEIVEAARAYFAAVDRRDGIVAAGQALREAVEAVR